ncbi:glycoside hydrolase [Epithele typhae]|uniref:glycoside hydrolase n=1 Tax=Epithele typhae TaxID=378194 RepID=UPI002008C91D|nr:glycoside hydrolase [Epithele typhae]KAH9940545.1 glycoside hydrolase [Epithele typhae]
MYSLNNLSAPNSSHNKLSTDYLPSESTTSLSHAPFLGNSQQQNAFYGGTYATKEGQPRTYLPAPRRAAARGRPFYKRPWFWILVVIVIAGAAALIIYLAVIRPKHNDGAKNSSPANNDTAAALAVHMGGDGSTVTMEDGSTFTYANKFGGYWVSNPRDPFDNSARPNSWTPPLNQSWTWGKDRVNGVNIGGLFVLEPFISPALFQDNPGTADEWTLSVALAAKGKLQETLENHYDTFITEQDIAEIAGAGLNWIRVPIPFWAIETWDNVGTEKGQTVAEPFLARVCWKYILRLLGWARKYGLRVLLDLHTIPGSQNGYNHSGKLGSLNWLHGVMGLANAERSLDYIRTLTEFFSQPEYQSLVPAFGILNEPFARTIDQNTLSSFYLEAYKMVRNITGIGEGKGPYISYHDGFINPSSWVGFLEGADRIVMDTHPYFAFTGKANRDPVNVTATGSTDPSQMGGVWPKTACDSFSPLLDKGRKGFGVTVAGEFSNGFNDCGLFVVGVNSSTHYGPDCDYWQDPANWSDATKAGILNFALASMDALGDWFFWTWKIGKSTAGVVASPLWSYQLGLASGWMPADPRTAEGACGKFGATGDAFDGAFQPWQTGGVGAGTIVPGALAAVPTWPPALKDLPEGAADAAVPRYTSTASAVTLPPMEVATATVTASVGSGWADAADSGPAVTAIAGCAYPNAWNGVGAQVPASGCQPAA